MKLFTISLLTLGIRSITAATTDTANDVVNGVCKALTLIYARGSGEPGNMGSTTQVGPGLADRFISVFGSNKVAVQGVNYPADALGNIILLIDPKSQSGSVNMSALAKQAATKCPTTKIVLAGFSQGAGVVHGALMNLPQPNKISAAVTFGDLLHGNPFTNIDLANTKMYCAPGDPVCGSNQTGPGHNAYVSNGNIPDAVSFVQSKVGWLGFKPRRDVHS